MTFFDPKEDVIDIECTQFGKFLLSEGKWNPKYYAFFDDDILYDSRYGGMSESQNDAQARITGSVRTHTQYAFAGIETEINHQIEQLPWYGSEFEKTNVQPTADRDYALSLSMGRSDIGNENFPAWAMTFLNGELGSSIPYSTSSLGIMPFIEMTSKDVVFKTSVKNKNEQTLTDGAGSECEGVGAGGETTGTTTLAGALNQVGESSPAVDPSDLILANRIYEDGTYISIEEDYLLLEMLENNTPFEEENLEIEVFLHAVNDKEQPILTPLKFYKKRKMVVNDILLDDNDPELNQQFQLTPEYVEYFFNVWVDDEIDKETLCKSVALRETLGLYVPPINCPERFDAESNINVLYTCPEFIKDANGNCIENPEYPDCSGGETCVDEEEDCPPPIDNEVSS